MMNSKNNTNGATWKRRSVAAAAATAMVFTALSTASASTSEVAEEEAAYGWHFEYEASGRHHVVVEADDDVVFKAPPRMRASRGAGWA